MSKTLRYRQSVVIPAPVEAVWALLVDPKNHVDLHPLVRDIEIIARGGPEGEGGWVEFEVLDGLKLLGLFEFEVRYRARMTRRPGERRLTLVAHAQPRLDTTTDWRLHAEGEGTRIDEAVELSAPGYLVRYATRQSRRSHAGMFAALQRRVQAGCSSSRST